MTYKNNEIMMYTQTVQKYIFNNLLSKSMCQYEDHSLIFSNIKSDFQTMSH